MKTNKFYIKYYKKTLLGTKFCTEKYSDQDKWSTRIRAIAGQGHKLVDTGVLVERDRYAKH
jgi:hypothetical protein